MPVLTEPMHPGEFMATEANGRRARDNAVITGGHYGAGRVLGIITASGKFTALTPAAGDGSQVAAGILWQDTDASGGDKTAVVVDRAAEVNASELDWGALNAGQITTAIGQLKALGILVRTAA